MSVLETMKTVNPVTVKDNKTFCSKGLREKIQALVNKKRDSVIVGKTESGDYIIAEIVDIEDVINLEK